MNQLKVLFCIFFLIITNLQAQDNCEKYIEGFEKKLKESSPFDEVSGVFQKLESCAKSGNAKAQNYLGILYLEGIDVEKSELKAFEYILKSAKQDYANAQYNIGRFYKYGIGCNINFRGAIAWFKKSSKNGNKKAAYALGYMYYKGLGVSQNYVNAVNWFKKSNTPMARHYLGLCYYFGYGLEANESKALEYILNNPTTNSKTLLKAIETDKKQKQEQLIEETLNVYDVEDDVAPYVIEQSKTTLENPPDETLNNEDIKNEWTGNLIQYDWSGKHIRRVIPVDVTIEDSKKENINFYIKLDNQELSTTAIWQDETLYFEDLTTTIRLQRLYPDFPDKLTLNYNFLMLSLQQYRHEGVSYLIGALDTFIDEWTEYGKPMSLVLKPKGAKNTLSAEAILNLAEQEEHFIKLYPVPFIDKLTVQYELETNANVSAQLISLDGLTTVEILSNTPQQAGTHTHNVPININLPTGIYVVRVHVNNKVHTRMVVNK